MTDGDGGSGRQQLPAGNLATREQETVQTTLSAIGDLGVAGSDMFARSTAGRAPRSVVTVIVFFLFVYVLCVTVVQMTSGSSALVRLLLMPLFPALCAVLAFLSSRVWKRRATEFKSKLKVWQEALESLGHEAANAANAVQANLTGFRDANPQIQMAEHLEEIEAAAKRIAVAVRDAAVPMKMKAKKPGDGSSSNSPSGAHGRVAP